MKKSLLFFFFTLSISIFSNTNNPIDSIAVQKELSKVFSFSSNATGELDHKYVAQNYALSAAGDSIISKAKTVINAIDKTGSYVSVLGAEDMISLPVGVKKKFGKYTTTMGVSAAKFYPKYTEVTLFVKLEIAQIGVNGKQRELFFGADNVKISHKGGIYGDMNISLLGDVAIPINGNKALLELKGGFDMKTGAIENKTFITIDCSGIKKIGVEGAVVLSRKLVEPLSKNYTPLKDKLVKVRGKFKTIATDWNDILAEVDFNYPFQVTNDKAKKDSKGNKKGKGGLIIDVQNAVFDFSDLRNSENVKFPKNYKEKYLIKGNEKLWKGIFIEKVNVILSEEFRKRNKNNRLEVKAENFIIDGEGLTGEFGVKNLFDIEDGDASGWQISVTDLYASFMAGKLTGAGFGGHVGLPTSGKITKQDILNQTELVKGLRKAAKYTAIIDVGNEDYNLALEPVSKKGLHFPVFMAEAHLKSNSSITLKVKEGKFRPKANLYGSLTIKGGSGASKKLVDFKGITFENLQLQTVSPHISVDYMGYEGEHKLSKFPVTISDIGVTTNDKIAALKFTLDVNLMSKGFAGNTRLEIIGAFENKTKISTWKFKKLKLHKIEIKANLGSVKFRGLVDIKDNDPVYGNGFYGELEADFNDINVKATAWFGKTDVRYWYVDAYANLSGMATKPTIGVVEVNGFGGGAYYHMKKMSKAPKLVYQGEVDEQGNAIAVKTPKPPSGMDYVPDAKSGLGFRAMIGFALANEKAFNGKVGFEMAFNNHGGLNRIFFFGEGHIMKAIGIPFGDKFKEKLTKLENKINDFGENNKVIQKLKETNLVEYSKVSFPQDGFSFDVGIDAHFSMEMDFVNKSFHSEMEVYLNTPGGILKGMGDRGRAGWAVFHTGPDGWYLHMGTPKDPIGLRLGIGPLEAEAKTYLMIGDKILGSPPPPRKVADILGVDLNSLDYMRDLNALGDGRGFALGMHVSVNTGDLNFLIFYARFSAGIGFDIMIKDYGETACKGSGQIGIDGWYANGQAYAYVEGELGIKIDLWFIKGKFPILKAGAAVLLQAKLPNPAWFRGYIGGHYSILGGLVSGRFRFKLEIGDECEIIGGAPLGGMKIISGVTPNDNAKEMDVFITPQAAFNMKINKPFKLEDDEDVKTYRILLDEFTVTKDGNTINGELEWNDSNDVVNFVSFDVLPPNSTIKVKVAVSFQELKNDTWVTLMIKGKKAQEIEERTFTTGTAPDYIPLKNILYTYPVIEQSYFYQKESPQGYVKLKRGQPYLFAPESKWKQIVRYTNKTGHIVSNKRVSYDKENKQVNFNLSKLHNTKKYSLSILSYLDSQETSDNGVSYTSLDIGQEGNTIKIKNKEVQTVVNNDAETEILTYNFTTSKYDTFKQKIRDKNVVKHYLEPIYSDVHAIQTDVKKSERFDRVELEGAKYSGNEPLIAVEATLEDSYYKERIHQLIYNKYPLEKEFTVNRNVNDLGIPPKRGVDVLTWYIPYLKENSTFSLLDSRIPFRYNLPYHYKKDFIDIQYKVVNKYLHNPTQYSSQIKKYNYIINGIFPAIRTGKYKVKMQYVMPGKLLGTNAIFKYKNPF